MRGDNNAVAVENLEQFRARRRAAKVLEAMYAGSSDQVLNGTGTRHLRSGRAAAIASRKRPTQPAAGAQYPNGRFGDSLQQIAQLIKADVGVEVAFADIGGWDHHVESAELGRPAGATCCASSAVAGGVLSGSGRPHGRRRGGDHVGVRPHGAEKTAIAAPTMATPTRCS